MKHTITLAEYILANESNNRLGLVLANDVALDDDGWALIAPYGEHAQSREIRTAKGVETQRFIQVTDGPAVDAILSNENSVFRRLKRAFVGIQAYKGHPDLKRYEPTVVENSATTSQKPVTLGMVDNLRKTERGLEAHFSILPDEEHTVANEGYKFPSVLWNVEQIGERDGALVVRPFKLLSVGLTPYPNISGVDSLANAKPGPDAANPATTPQSTMKDKITGWLAAKGITLANEATDAAILEAIQKHVEKLDGNIVVLTNEKGTLTIQVGTLTTERDGFKNKNGELTTSLANATTALANERKAHHAALVDLAIAQGKVAVAERDNEIKTLGNATTPEAVEAAKTALANKARVHKVEAVANSTEARAVANAVSPRELFLGAVQKKQKENPGMSYTKASAAVMAENPALKDAFKAAQPQA